MWLGREVNKHHSYLFLVSSAESDTGEEAPDEPVVCQPQENYMSLIKHRQHLSSWKTQRKRETLPAHAPGKYWGEQNREGLLGSSPSREVTLLIRGSWLELIKCLCSATVLFARNNVWHLACVWQSCVDSVSWASDLWLTNNLVLALKPSTDSGWFFSMLRFSKPTL